MLLRTGWHRAIITVISIDGGASSGSNGRGRSQEPGAATYGIGGSEASVSTQQ